MADQKYQLNLMTAILTAIVKNVGGVLTISADDLAQVNETIRIKSVGSLVQITVEDYDETPKQKLQ